MSQVKLAEALLRRKELNDKVAQLRQVKQDYVFRAVVRRIKVSDDLDEVQAAVPRVSAAQVTAAFDHYAKQLRRIDGAIQQANWTTEIEVPEETMQDYEEPEALKGTEIQIARSA